MGMHDIERRRREVKEVDVAGAELDIGDIPAGRLLAGLGQHRFAPVHPERGAGLDAAGQVGGDGARPTPDIEQSHARPEPVEEIACRVLGRAPAV